jgi:uncharacterized protein
MSSSVGSNQLNYAKQKGEGERRESTGAMKQCRQRWRTKRDSDHVDACCVEISKNEQRNAVQRESNKKKIIAERRKHECSKSVQKMYGQTSARTMRRGDGE